MYNYSFTNNNREKRHSSKNAKNFDLNFWFEIFKSKYSAMSDEEIFPNLITDCAHVSSSTNLCLNAM